MGREEQAEEREVLDSIFPDEIQGKELFMPLVSLNSSALRHSNPPKSRAYAFTDISEHEFRISVLLDITNDDGDESEPPMILLQVKYPESYPDDAPVLDILASPNAPTHPFFSVNGDRQLLLDSLAEAVQENLGMQMIFTLHSTLKENAEQVIADRQEAARNAQEQKLLAIEAEENKKFHGTPVTVETFGPWRDQFRKEMEEERLKTEEDEAAAEKKRNRGKEAVVLLTGRQLWERGLAGKVEEEEDDDEDDGKVLTEGVESLKV